MEAITLPWWSRKTTPSPASSISQNTAPSKLIFKLIGGGGFHLTCCFGKAPDCILRAGRTWANVWRVCEAEGVTWESGKGFELVRSVFWRDQIVHTRVAKSSGFFFSSNTWLTSSKKFENFFVLRNCHSALDSHKANSSWQSHNAWWTSSVAEWQWSSSESTLRATRFFFTGIASLLALHRKFLILFGTDKLHNIFHILLPLSREEEASGDDAFSLARKLYPDLTE